MIKNTAIYFLISLCFFVSCDKNGVDIPGPPIPPTPPETADRTVIIYIIADNNLSDNADKNLNQIIAGAANGSLNNGYLLVYIDSRKETPQLLQIKAKKDGAIIKELVRDYPEQNSASPEIMTGVINEVVTKFPADNYGLILWSHGTAWMPKDAEIMTRSFGDDNGNMLELNELKKAIPALPENKKYDFILFDACYMGNTEVAFALKDKAKHIIGSPTEVLSDGFPYQNIIGKMFSSSIDLQGICTDFYTSYNQGPFKYATISLVATEEMDMLANCMRNITANHRDKIKHLPLQPIQALDYLYNKRVLYDLDDYIKNLATEEEYGTFKTILKKVILYKASTPYSYFQRIGPVKIDSERFSGLSVYIMDQYPKLDDWYSQLDWHLAIYGD